MSEPVSVSLIKKYLSGQCSPEETNRVLEWFDAFDGLPDDIAGLSASEKQVLEERLFSSILHQIKVEDKGFPGIAKKKTILLWHKWAVAASLVLVLSFIAIWRYQAAFLPKNNPGLAAVQEIKPGGNKATLRLANGAIVVLNEANIGQLAKQQNIRITKTGEGKLVYTVVSGPDSHTVAYNTISTPVGGQYQVELPDGTKVWLNAKSSLTFPTAFTGKERKVQMTGEVYFEVAKNAAKPFTVQSGPTDIRVLGTHFNVMAYPDEHAQQTTLLEGSIRISTPQASSLLKPGQQAVLIAGHTFEIKDQVDLERAMAWKNGMFNFKNMDIRDVMRQVSRWYDIDVNFEGRVSNLSYTGTIPRNANLSELLSMLHFTGLHYQLDGNRLTIKE